MTNKTAELQQETKEEMKFNPMEAVESIEETIFYRMKIVRTSLKLNCKEFAAKLGVYPNRISEVENGKGNVSLKMLEEIGKLGFDLNWLVNGKVREQEIHGAIGDDVDLFKLFTKVKKLDDRDLRFLAAVVDGVMANYHQEEKDGLRKE